MPQKRLWPARAQTSPYETLRLLDLQVQNLRARDGEEHLGEHSGMTSTGGWRRNNLKAPNLGCLF